MALPTGTWWSRAALEGGTATLFATEAPAADVAAWTARLFPDTDVIEYADSADGIYRGAAFRNADLVGCVFVGPAAARPQFEAVRTLLRDAGGGAIIDRRLVLSGQGLDGVAAAGPTVCACFSVGLAAIQAAIASGGATPEAIGQALKAGTNCGSCVPELRRIIARELAP